nr:helix-turn-helix domain-containing protein [uncultured Sandarakinorhabdus sp.]
MTEQVDNTLEGVRTAIPERRAIEMIDFADPAGALQSMILQAETLLRTCRALVAQGRETQANGELLWPTQGMRDAQEQQDETGTDWRARSPSGKSDKSDKRTWRRYDHMDFDVDLLQIFKSRLPDLSMAPLVVLTTLLANHGRIVSNDDFRKALGTESPQIVKVYVCRLRNLFRAHGVDVEISVLKGGYGVPRDCATSVLTGLGFDEAQLGAILNSAVISRSGR